MNTQVFDKQLPTQYPLFGDCGVRSPKRAENIGGMVADISARYRAAMGTEVLIAGLATLAKGQSW